MKYKTNKQSMKPVLDDSLQTHALAILEGLIDEKLDIIFEYDEDIYSLISQPEKYNLEPDLVRKIRELKDLLVIMGGLYVY